MEMSDFYSFSGNSRLVCYLNIAAVSKHNGTEDTIGWKFLQSNFPSLFLLRSDCTFPDSISRLGPSALHNCCPWREQAHTGTLELDYVLYSHLQR